MINKDILTEQLHQKFYLLLEDREKNSIPHQFINLYDNEIIKNIPAKLYKYKFDDEPYKLSSILDNKLYFNHPKNFNDPLDSSYLQDMIAKLENSYNILEDNERNNALNVLFPIAVSCLSSVKPDSSESMLLWAHYAQFHRGICVEYNTKDIIDNLKSIAGKCTDTAIVCMLPVKYEKSPMPERGLYIKNFLIDIFYKRSSWQYEREWRIVLPRPFITVKPAKIWFGCKNNTQMLYEYLCKKNDIDTENVKHAHFL